MDGAIEQHCRALGILAKSEWHQIAFYNRCDLYHKSRAPTQTKSLKTAIRSCSVRSFFFFFFFFFTLVTGPRRSLGLKSSDTRVYEPQIRGCAQHRWMDPAHSNIIVSHRQPVPHGAARPSPSQKSSPADSSPFAGKRVST